MRNRVLAGVLVSAMCRGAAAAPGEDVTLWERARVWDGRGFVERTLAVRGDRIVAARGVGAGARRIDVAGRLIVPAYANAHCHITNANREWADDFLRDGIYYVWNPNSVVIAPAVKGFYGRPDTPILKIAMGGVTERGGHPEKLYVDVLGKYVYPGHDRAWFVGNAFHYGETPAEIDAALDTLVAQGADFVKAYLLHSEDWARRHGNRAFYGQTGLNPANMRYLVRAARRRGLKVAVHVETAADARVAARAGAAMLAHVPGYEGAEIDGSDRLTAADARLIAARRMVVVPTFDLGPDNLKAAAESGAPAPTAAQLNETQRSNLALLKAAGVPVLMGTDGFGPIVGEARRWVAIGAMTHAEAAAAVFATGSKLFPERRVGCLAEGCEADFLVLGADPTLDVGNLGAIERRVKAGRELVVPPKRVPPVSPQ